MVEYFWFVTAPPDISFNSLTVPLLLYSTFKLKQGTQFPFELQYIWVLKSSKRSSLYFLKVHWYALKAFQTPLESQAHFSKAIWQPISLLKNWERMNP